MGSPVVRGGDVYPKPNDRVSLQWLTACEEERALTSDLMDRIADLSNLSTALGQVVRNGGSAGIDGMTVLQYSLFATAGLVPPMFLPRLRMP